MTGVQTCALPISVIAIAKQEEEIYLPGEMLPRRLDEKGMALRYVQEIRNEAHRFAIAYNRLLRKKTVLGDGKKAAASKKTPGR